MKNFFGQVNEKKIGEAIYEMNIHLLRNTGAGAVSFKVYEYLLNGLKSENERLARELESVENDLANKNKEIEQLKNHLGVICV